MDLFSSAMNWSGANSVRDRFEEGRKLALLNEQIAASGKASLHIVIARSHGGNVAMEALEWLQRRKRPPLTLATIGTPFLYMDDKPRLASTPLPGFGTFGLLAIVVYWILEGVRHMVPFLDAGWLAIGSILLSLVVTSWMMIFFFNPPHKADQFEVWKACSGVPDPDTEMLVLRGTEDEAGMALTLSTIGIRLTDLLTIGYAFVKFIVYRSGCYVLLVALALLCSAAMMDLILGTSHVRQIMSLRAGLSHLAVTAVWVLGLFTAARLVVPALAKGSFGWELIRNSGLMTVSAQSVPDGQARLTVKTMSRGVHRRLLSLHSLYDHQDVAPTIASWARALLESQGRKLPARKEPPDD